MAISEVGALCALKLKLKESPIPPVMLLFTALAGLKKAAIQKALDALVEAGSVRSKVCDLK